VRITPDTPHLCKTATCEEFIQKHAPRKCNENLCYLSVWTLGGIAGGADYFLYSTVSAVIE
jgi:hypothetical protein